MNLVDSILAMQGAYYESTGRRLTILAVGPRLFDVLLREAEKNTTYLSGLVRCYDRTISLHGLTIIESIGEGMVWA